ncbi:MAG: orotidine-5'-phosphate decarboxylase [Candidatus Omnitrophica bacterium]|nr:orotidine-5'-phosphate decarboxylase [Candidatus Omnitrophota bacterium]MCM8825929.1 orotidine-5'-phosphate decarboxylase [Candidatus Omnitrophota bacterium]
MVRKCKIIFALDFSHRKDFSYWLDVTEDLIDFYKIGLVAFTGLGVEAIKIVKRRKKRIFLDLKFFDIPNTMIKSAMNLIPLGIDMLDFHLLADKDSLQFTLEEIRRLAKNKIELPYFLGVTILTSTYFKFTIHKKVSILVDKAFELGFDGVVLPGREAKQIREKLGKNFLLVCPGIRVNDNNDDQKMVVTVKEIKEIADYIVVGRPIYQAKEPCRVINEILKEIG